MNKEIIFTNSRGAEKYRAPLEGKGIRCTEFPLIKVKSIPLPPDLNPLIESTVLVFTSINGIVFFKQSFKKNLSKEFLSLNFSNKDFWAIGLESKNILKAWSKQRVYTPSGQHGMGLARALINFYQTSQKIVLIQGQQAEVHLELRLQQAGHAVTRMEFYGIKKVETLATSIARKIKRGTLVYLASPSAVMALADMLGITCLKKCALMAIGPTTAKKMLSYGIAPRLTLNSPDYNNALREIENYFVGA